MNLFKTTFSTVIALALVAGVAIHADSVTGISGIWDNAVGSQANFGLTGEGTNTIRWGTPATFGGQKSGYSFVGDATPFNVVIDTPFSLGTFTHFNNPITAAGGSLTSVDLIVTTSLLINGTPVGPIDFSFLFNHNETPNTGGGCCNDIVTFVNDSTDVIFDVGGVQYTMGLVGFKTSPNGPLLNQFSTIEGQDNSAQLYAQISKPSVFVPEPETYALMGGFLLLALVAMRRRGARRLFK